MRERAFCAVALATLHTVLLLGALVLFGYRRGALGSVLETTGTPRGIFLFAALWTIAALSAAWVLRHADPLADPPPSWGAAVTLGFVAGAVAGPAFLLAFAAGILDRVSLDLLIVLAFAGGFAGIVGGILGAVLGALDRCMLALALRAAVSLRNL